MTAAAAHLARMAARPRPAGSPAAAEAREYCADVLRTLGFAITEHSFEYSAFPGAWGAPAAGVVACLGAIGLFVGRRAAPVAALSFAAMIVALAGLAALGRGGVLRFPAMRRRGINLVAVRGTAEPRVWLVAHIDSKWQPVPTIARVVSVVSTTLGVLALAVTALTSLHLGDRAAAVLLMATWVAAIPLMLSVVGVGSHGAVDNASGVATVLDAAAAVEGHAPVGVVITDAEELALAGARAWASTRGPAVALNCDGVDDRGALTVMVSRPAPAKLIGAFERIAAEQGEPLRVIRLLPGVLTDSVAFVDAGWTSVTLSRGSARTLNRIHTARDSLAAMDGSGIPAAARLLARTAMELA